MAAASDIADDSALSTKIISTYVSCWVFLGHFAASKIEAKAKGSY